MELSYSRILYKDSIWDNLYNHPEFSVSLFYTSLGNKSVFGEEIALFPSITFNIIKNNKFNIYSRFGLGISYISKTYHQENNIKNYAVSKPINIHFDFLLGGNYKLTDKFELNAGINVFSYIVDHNSCKADTASFALDILDCTFEHEFSKLTYSVYPNPSNGVFNINLNQVAEIEVFNLTGKKILSLSYSTPNKNLGFNLSKHPKGIYFLRFSTKNGYNNSRISLQ